MTTWQSIGFAALDSTYGNGTFTDTNIDGVTNRFYQARSGAACSQVIGFINMTLPPGTNLIANPLYQINDHQYPQNTANGWLVFLNDNSYSLPDQSLIMNWNGLGFNVETFNPQLPAWLPDGDNTLLPGGAEFFVNPTANAITMPFAGLIAPGVSTKEISPGINFVSSMIPQAGRIHSDLGYNPNTGDKVLLWTGHSYSTNTYTGGGWTPSEPSISVGEGFVLVASQSNSWAENFSACQSGLFVVTANPLWTDTGIHVNSNDMVSFAATGSWTGDGSTWVGPGGLTLPETAGDLFLTNTLAKQFSLIAFVGPNPYYSGNTNEWGNGSYFPRRAGEGYWELGATSQFTTDRGGELWFGFNDDAVDGPISDNYGTVAGQIQITGP